MVAEHEKMRASHEEAIQIMESAVASAKRDAHHQRLQAEEALKKHTEEQNRSMDQNKGIPVSFYSSGLHTLASPIRRQSEYQFNIEQMETDAHR